MDSEYTAEDASDSGSRNHPSLKDTAQAYIREGIVSGRYGPGAKVDQDEIANALGISRLPVREALIELAQKGFVATIPRRGAFVTELQVEDVEDHFEALGLLFALASRRAAKEIDAATLEGLRRLHEEIAALGPDGDLDLCRRLNLQFVRTINREGSSRLLRSILQFLSGTLPGSYYTESPAWLETEALYRERILAAISARDAEEAADVAVEHMRTCGSMTVEVLRERRYWATEERAGREKA